MRTLLIAIAACSALAYAEGTQRVIYTKSFPGSDPEYVSIALDHNGMIAYKEMADDDDPEMFQLEPQFTDKIFNLSEKLNHFKKNVESGLKVANMGAKTFRWEDGNDAGQVQFNYSTDPNAQALWNWFEWITDSERAFLELKRTVRHDKLGVNDAVNKIIDLWMDSKLVATPQLLPLLDKVATDDAYVHVARSHAADLADAIRAQSR
jgi:hypothetical protein